MSFARRASKHLLELSLLSFSIACLSHCNSKEEKTVYPRDPNTPALFAPSDLSDAERQKRIDQAAADLRAADGEADRELERIKARSQERKKAYAKQLAESRKLTAAQARKDIKGLELDSLNLNNGDSFSKVTVLRADEIGVTISHREGARRIKYKDLPKAIQERCHYDPSEEFPSTLPKVQTQSSKQVTPQNRNVSQAIEKPSSTKQKTVSTHTHKTSPKPKITPNGSLSITVKKTYQRYISGHGKVHFKTLKIHAMANVEATIYAQNQRIGKVRPGERTELITQSGYHGKYEIRLVDTNGKVLDTESHSRKSGLGGARGL